LTAPAGGALLLVEYLVVRPGLFDGWRLRQPNRTSAPATRDEPHLVGGVVKFLSA